MHRRVDGQGRLLQASMLAEVNRVCQSLMCVSEWLFRESTHRLNEKVTQGLGPWTTLHTGLNTRNDTTLNHSIFGVKPCVSSSLH